MTQGAEESRYLRAHLYDKELARMVSHLAAARLEAARNTLVPPEVVQAHPHLLLVLEHYERSANAAVHRWPEKFLVHQRKAEDEELVFRSVLKQSGWTLPELRRSKR